MIQPLLRFSGFTDEWNKKTISEIGIKVVDGDRGNNYPSKTDFFDDGYCLFLSAKNVTKSGFEFSSKQFISKEKDDLLRKGKLILGDVILTTRGTVGNISYFDDSVPFKNLRINSGMVILRNNGTALNQKFMYASFFSNPVSKHIKKVLFGSAQPQLTVKEINKFKFGFGKIEEQQKIADFLSSVDKKISLLKNKQQLLSQYKKGVMQQLFSQQIRFKDENGQAFPEWQDTKFNKVFERVIQKNKENNQNVLTISAQRGLINQQKYFNKSVSAKDVTGYYLLENGDFAYNKSYSTGYPMGAIKRLNNYDKGVVSTLYICFKSFGEQHNPFWEQYFEAGLLNREISKIAQEGARNHGLLNVSVTEFFRDMTVHAPTENEQIKIAEFLNSLDKKIELVNQQIEHTQTFKKGLLQQMFV